MQRGIILLLFIVIFHLTACAAQNIDLHISTQDINTIEDGIEMYNDPDVSYYSNDLSDNKLSNEPTSEFRYGLPIGNPLTEVECKYFGEALINALNNENYYYGEDSFAWPLNDLGKTEVEIYKSLNKVNFILLTPIVGNQKDSYYFQKECYFSFGLYMDKYGTFEQLSRSGYCQSDVEGLRNELIANNMNNIYPHTYLGNIVVDIPKLYLPDNPTLFSYIPDIIDIIKDCGIRNFTLYAGLQDRQYNGKDNSDEIVCWEEIEYSIVESDKKYIGRCIYTSDSPVLHLMYPETELPYHEPNNTQESYRIEQIIKLGEKYEITD